MTGPAAHRLRRTLTGAALAGTLLALTGCASSVDPIERLGRKAAERMGTQGGTTVAEAEGAVRPGGEAVRPARADDLVRHGGHAD
ncbi:hypothetical protein ACWGQ4_15850 [Streptomyces sp. NPDC055721]|uniref:hypothetical protein n=1 Tax=Streptomyces sp. NPDC127132 TaxID=3345374 RepID=UPI003635B785